MIRIAVWAIVSISLLLFQETEPLEDWENPAVFARNQVEPHVPLIPFDDLESALRNDPQSSPYFQSLNGSWRFQWLATPKEIPAGFFEPTFETEEWDVIEVPSNWQTQGYGHAMFRNVAHTFSTQPPKVPSHYNPVGLYRRSFDIPEGWDRRQVLLHFEGIKSASYVWVNGQEVGYNEGGMTPAEYRITDYLQPGRNTLAVQVLRYSDGTYLEAQDMWRLSGIYRDVYLSSPPSVHIRDVYVRTDLDQAYRSAELLIKVQVENFLQKKRRGYRIVARLLDADGQPVFPALQKELATLGSKEVIPASLQAHVANPSKWSAEKPNLYLLLLELVSSDGKTCEVISQNIGFREVEIKRQAILINGVAVKLNGVNRHEHDPRLGRTSTKELMEQDLRMMKQFNINLVRTSHYPPDPKFLELADRYGMYVVDEVGDEAHAFRHLSGEPAWSEAYLDRMRGMVLRDRNHPSIIFWSAGNESGTGGNLALLIKEGKKLDPSRPAWMYGATSVTPDQPFEDIVGPRYPSPDRLEEFAQIREEEDPRPSFMDEYIAATGNSLGHFEEYWKLIRQYRRLTGGAIWDWVSPGLVSKLIVTPDSTGNRNDGSVMGKAALVEGRFGKALSLSGHDEWVELYRDPKLDVEGKELTLSLWVFPRGWRNSNHFITKGHQYGLIQKDAATVQFWIFDRDKIEVSAVVPKNWDQHWHHLAGVYNGSHLNLYLDGDLFAQKSFNGRIRTSRYPVNMGKNAEIQGQNYAGELSNAILDEVQIYDQALSQVELQQIMQGPSASSLSEKALVWLRFETFEEKGEFYSLGIGARSYGLVWPDRTIQPELWQVKKTPQPVRFEPADIPTGRINVSNLFNFTNLKELKGRWKLLEDDTVLQEGSFRLDLPPGQSRVLTVPFRNPELRSAAEYRLLLQCTLLQSTVWAERGHEVAWEEFVIPYQVLDGPELNLSEVGALNLRKEGQSYAIAGADFSYTFDSRSGRLVSLRFKEKELLLTGPIFNCWRAPTANELDEWRNPPIVNQWLESGIDRLEHKVTAFEVGKIASGAVRVMIKTIAAAPGTSVSFENKYLYHVLGSGDMILRHRLIAHGDFPEWQPGVEMWLPRVGLQMTVPGRFNRFLWYGRGPFETYPDRKTGAKIGVYSGTVQQQYSPYLIPQDYGNKTDVRWATLTDENGFGLMVTALPSTNLSVQHYSTDSLTRANYRFQLEPHNEITVNIDHAVTGVGGTPVPTLPKYRVMPGTFDYTVCLRPVSQEEASPMELSKRKLPYIGADFIKKD